MNTLQFMYTLRQGGNLDVYKKALNSQLPKKFSNPFRKATAEISVAMTGTENLKNSGSRG